MLQMLTPGLAQKHPSSEVVETCALRWWLLAEACSHGMYSGTNGGNFFLDFIYCKRWRNQCERNVCFFPALLLLFIKRIKNNESQQIPIDGEEKVQKNEIETSLFQKAINVALKCLPGLFRKKEG